MSGRPWVKLATKLHTDPAMMTIPRESLGNWCLCLSLAGANDDDGRLGTVAEVAWHLRITESDVTALVDVMRGRLAVVDGVVTVRDWAQWQPPRDVTNAKRQAEHRAKKAVTASNDVTAVTVTPLEVEVEVEVEREPEEEKETTSRRQQPRRAASAEPATTRDAMFDAFCLAWGYDPDKPGQVKGLAGAFSARCKRVAPEATPDDLTAFCVAEKARDVQGRPAWGSVTRSHNTTDAFIGWWQSRISADGSQSSMRIRLGGVERVA